MNLIIYVPIYGGATSADIKRIKRKIALALEGEALVSGTITEVRLTNEERR